MKEIAFAQYRFDYSHPLRQRLAVFEVSELGKEAALRKREMKIVLI